MMSVFLQPIGLLAFWSPGPLEMLLLATVALLLYGGDLPNVARSWGKSFSEFRRGLSGIQNELNDVIYGEPERLEYHQETSDSYGGGTETIDAEVTEAEEADAGDSDHTASDSETEDSGAFDSEGPDSEMSHAYRGGLETGDNDGAEGVTAEENGPTGKGPGIEGNMDSFPD